MDIPIVLAYKTAWLVQHTTYFCELQQKILAADANMTEPNVPSIGISSYSITPHSNADTIRNALTAWGIPQDQLEQIHILVSFAWERPRQKFVTPHAFGRLLTSENVLPIAEHLLIVTPEVCFAEAATWMSELELIEYGFELCGDYSILLDGTSFERPALTTCAKISKWLDVHSNIPGSKRARKALRCVKDKPRSPMETASCMLITCPRRLGGFQYRNVELNHRIDIPTGFSRYSSSPYYELDIYAPRTNVGIEYDGSDHDAGEQREHDAERLSTLALMSYTMHVLTKAQFSNQLSLHRACNAISASLRLKPCTTAQFQKNQNELRRFVTRRWASSESK